VVTSPPYDDARTYGNAVSWRFEDYQRLGDAIFTGLKPGGHALVVIDSPVREWRKGFGSERGFTPWRVMLDWAERVGFRVPDRLAYGRMGAPGAFKGRFRNDWEPLLWFQRPGAEGYFNSWEISTHSKHHFTGCGSVRAKDGELGERVKVRPTSRNVIQQRKNRGTFWDYGVTGSTNDDQGLMKTGHPARYALRFAVDAVLCFCPPGGLVVDPFSGSGTTAVATVRFNRSFAGSDLFADKHGKPWAQVAHERVQLELERKRPAQPLTSA
jgi:hypothetical protein